MISTGLIELAFSVIIFILLAVCNGCFFFTFHVEENARAIGAPGGLLK